MLLAARTGHGLLIAGTNRCAFHAVSSSAEHALATTTPRLGRLDDVEGPN
jgi:hypothetical protein